MTRRASTRDARIEDVFANWLVGGCQIGLLFFDWPSTPDELLYFISLTRLDIIDLQISCVILIDRPILGKMG